TSVCEPAPKRRKVSSKFATVLTRPRSPVRRPRGASDRAGGVEGGADVAEVGGAIVTYGDGEDVEAAGDLAETLPLEVVLGEADEAPPLPPLDRGRWGVAPARLAALHLDEHPDATVAADEVELAVREPHVALDDGEA